MPRHNEPTYEDHADLISDTIVRLAASDDPLPKGTRAFLAGYVPSILAAKQEMKAAGMNVDQINMGAMTPKKCDLIFRGEGNAVHVTTVERLGYFAKRRLTVGQIHERRTLAEVTTKQFSESGSVAVIERLRFWLNGNEWFPTDEKFIRVDRTSKKIDQITGRWERWERCTSTATPSCEMAAFAEWSRRTCWTIELGMADAPAVVVNTDPTGVRELLRMRDVPENRTRREALKHWVSAHARKNRKDADAEHHVRRHLRGSTECDWFGLRCKIVPSPIDVAAVRAGVA